jgi:general secretion pathway protein A
VNRPLTNARCAESPPDNALTSRRADEGKRQFIGGNGFRLFFERYGILENPFGVSPDPRYLYQSRSHGEARASLIIGLDCGLGFQALIAPPGMGKTTVLFDLLERFRRVARTAFLFQIQGGARDFLRYLTSELNSEVYDSDLVNIQDAINRLLTKERRAGRKTIIVIDEAQSLSAPVLETVRMLSNFESSTEKLLQIVLAGQPQLAKKLAAPELKQLHQRISIVRTLVPFDLEDTKNYIEHRLQIAGYQGQPLFTPAALRSIWENSHGVPREINTLCFNALLLATAIKKDRIDSDILEEVIADLEPVGLTGTPRSPSKRSVTQHSTEETLSEKESSPVRINQPAGSPPPDYLQFYNLTRNPFHAAADPSFLCLTSSHRAALATLYSSMMEHKGVMLLTGHPGIGKSLTVACLSKLLNSGHVQAEYILGQRLSAHDISKFVTRNLASYDARDELQKKSADYFKQEPGQTSSVLLVDEAQDLSIETLQEIQLLAKLQSLQQRVPQVVLSGRIELEQMLNLDEFRELKALIAACCYLKPLDEEDTEKYIACRLRIACAGSHPGPVFHEDALASVCCHSRGIPGLINQLCASALVRGYELRQLNITAVIVEEVAKQAHSEITLQERIPHTKAGDANDVLKAAKVLLEVHLGLQAMRPKK